MISFPECIALGGLLLGISTVSQAAPVKTADELLAAVKNAKEGDTIELAEGTFELEATLELKGKLTLKGAGMDKTVLTHSKKWKPSTKSLPDPEVRLEGLDTDAYLIRIQRDTSGVTISDMTLKCPQLHGAIFSWFHEGLHLHHLRIQETLYSGIRTFGMTKAKIHDCEFIDAGGRWDNGKPGVNGGITGGGIFACWMADSEIWDNRFKKVSDKPEREYYCIKGRLAIRTRIHHNTMDAGGFAIEFPFENDEDVEIDHNYLRYAVSIPRNGGGEIPKSGRTFHIHHNWFRDSYSIEFVRNGVEIDHNLFDFDVTADHGNLISAFGSEAAKGPARFHNNLVSNPGRGVIWMNDVYNNLEVRNNHIKCRTTVTPRIEGLFGFNPECEFTTIRIRDNIIECEGTARPLFRSPESYAANVENNKLINLADKDKLKNPKADRVVGPERPLTFRCGVKGEFIVDGWNGRPSR